ncbi:MAG TPA: phospholipase D-like domain-containing protein [Cyclobacteriaceae bacterium]|nr:phospholipase D-like domain-containing protein [Cyclobacteriaceae bacterium]
MKLIIQPEDGIGPLLAGIKSAKKTIEIVIFRFDRADIEAALKAAVGRGVTVHALIAYTNRGGEKNLRKLEMRLLGAGVTVVRTAKDLLRYHDKMIIIDRTVLYVLSFNFTHLDIDHSRGFGIITKHTAVVQEAVKLFEADTSRKAYSAGHHAFIVSPANARKQLALFIKKAKKQLLIYDPKIGDTQMLDLLESRAKAGVEIKIIGRLGRPSAELTAQKLSKTRLHTRTIIRDQRQAFVGSQSLRQAELDSRREVGIIVHDSKVVSTMIKTFDADWDANKQTKNNGESKGTEEASKSKKIVKKAVKGLLKDQPHLAPIAQDAVQQVVEKAGNEDLSHKEVQETVKEAVMEAVKTEKVQDAIRDAIKEAVQKSSDPE